MASCRRLIGEAQPRERAARWFFTEWIYTSGAHVIEQDIELASAIAGDDLKPEKPWLPVDPAAEAWADELLPPTGQEPAALINPGAGWGAKRWPVERYCAVAQGLVERGFRVLVNAGPGEEPLAEAIVQATGGAATPSYRFTQSFDRRHPPNPPRDCRRYRPAPPGLCPWPAGGGHLRAHRPQPQRALRNQIQGSAQPGKPPRPHPLFHARGRPAHHSAG